MNTKIKIGKQKEVVNYWVNDIADMISTNMTLVIDENNDNLPVACMVTNLMQMMWRVVTSMLGQIMVKEHVHAH